MHTIILTGGEGKRLRPITCTMPKPMAPLLNKPTLFYTLELLKRHGLDDVTVAIGYMGGEIKKAVGDGRDFGLHVKYRSPSLRLGTAGSVKSALGNGLKGTVLVMSGDGLTDIDITAARKAHAASGASVTVVLSRVSEPCEYGIAVVDGRGFIKEFKEKPSPGEVFSDLANTGIYLIEPRVLQELPEDTRLDFSKDVFPALLKKGSPIHGWLHEGYWSDIGSVRDLLRTQRDMLDGRLAFTAKAQEREGVYIEAGAVVSNKAKLIPPCYIGSSAQVGAYAKVEPYSVICSGARLEEGSSVKRAVVFNNAVIGRGAEVRGAAVCEKAVLQADTAVFEGAVIGAGSVVQAGATVCPEVLIWPNKTAGKGERVENNIVWGQSYRISPCGSGFRGSADGLLTPEAAVRLGAAHASLFKLPAELCIGCDGSAQSVILKAALAAGTASVGVDALAAEHCSKPAFAAVIRQTGASGGVYVSAGEERQACVVLYDGKGIEAPRDTVRAVEKALSCGEHKPATQGELGIIRGVTGGELLMRSELSRYVDTELLGKEPRHIFLNAPREVCNDIASVMLRLGWRVDCAYDGKKLLPVQRADTLSLLVSDSEHITALIAPDTVLDHYSLLALIAADAQEKYAPMPLDTDAATEEYLKSSGVVCVAAPEDAASRRRFAADKGIYVPALLEPEQTIVKLCELFSKGVLQSGYEELPLCKRRAAEFSSPARATGAMLRRIIETEGESVSDIAEGLKLKLDTGWVTVSPCEERGVMRVVAGSRDAEYAKELCEVYLDKLRCIGEASDR